MEQFVMKTGVWLMLLLSALNLDSHLMVYYNYGKTFFLLHKCISGAISVSTGVFGDDIESTVLFSVNCKGHETELLHCSVSESGVCSEHSNAIICQGFTFCGYSNIISSYIACRCTD